jgi:hypothetical protein
MTRYLFPPKHLPHPHIAEHLAEVWKSALHQQAPIVPDGHDWPEWHWYPEGER